VDNVLRHHFAEPSVLAVFIEIVQCLLSFASNYLSAPISLAALRHLRTCGRRLCAGGVIGTHCASLNEALVAATESGAASALAAAGAGGGGGGGGGKDALALTEATQRGAEASEAAAAAAEAAAVDFAGGCSGVAAGGVAAAADSDSDTEDEEDKEGGGGRSGGGGGGAAAAGAAAAQAAAGGGGEGSEGGFMYSDCDAHMSVWWPLLTGLAALVADPRGEVSELALQTLYELLEGGGGGGGGADGEGSAAVAAAAAVEVEGKDGAQEGGAAGAAAAAADAPSPNNLFSPKLWELVFKGVLFPLFDDVRHGNGDGGGGTGGGNGVAAHPSSSSSLSSSSTRTRTQRAMESMVGLYARFYTSHLRLLLPDVLRLLHSCIAAPVSGGALAPGLPAIGVRCLRQLLLAAGGAFSSSVWDGVCREIAVLFAQTVPAALAAPSTRAALKLAPKAVAASAAAAGEDGEGEDGSGDGGANAPGIGADEAEEEADAKRWREQQEAAAKQEAADRAEAAAHGLGGQGGSKGGQGGGLPFDAGAVVAMCNVQLALQDAVGEVASRHFASLSQVHT
jgi:hypothetical protein